ncbi:MAG: hypothetical protein GXP09_03945 [Gammaproteobacteria bacterium]|nr:hypothetical protein [Gammaproteobacteria bacterium]
MQIEQTQWSPSAGWQPKPPGRLGQSANLLLMFGGTSLFKEGRYFQQIAQTYPNAHILGCSTAGEICGAQVSDDSLVVTAIHFEHTQVKVAHTCVDKNRDSCAAGEYLAKTLAGDDLAHVFVLSDGLNVNGCDLVKGIIRYLPDTVTVTGGLSGDGSRFQETLVLLNGDVSSDSVAAVAFYGDTLKVGYGSLGGWDAFGPECLITHSEDNVLYKLDGQPALTVYKKYIGEHAAGLPATGLLFPLSLRTPEMDTPVLRTLLAVDEDKQSLTFAGNIPMGAHAQLMKANLDRLVDGAVGAAKTSCDALGDSAPDLAILISCVGRKMVLKQRIEEEVEGVRNVFGDSAALTGFYSYGEISPFAPNAKCALHNQTMTITTLSE